MRQRFRELIDDHRGATAVEYCLIAALMMLVVLGAMSSVADRTDAMWDHVSSTVSAAVNG